MRTRIAAVPLCAFIALLGATSAQAQGIGGLVKKKVEEAKKGDAQPAAQEASFHSEDVLPITSTLLDGLQRGLETEIRLRTEFQKLLASYKTPEQYQSCTNALAATPEFMKIMEIIANLPDNATQADLQRATEKMNNEMKALITKHCGKQLTEDWPQEKQRERLEQIEAAAAAAVDPAKMPEPDDEPAARPEPVTADEPYAHEASTESINAAISLRAYQILKERVFPFCEAYEKGLIKLNGQPVNLQGTSTNMQYVFTAAEAAYLAPRCKQLMALLAQLL